VRRTDKENVLFLLALLTQCSWLKSWYHYISPIFKFPFVLINVTSENFKDIRPPNSFHNQRNILLYRVLP